MTASNNISCKSNHWGQHWVSIWGEHLDIWWRAGVQRLRFSASKMRFFCFLKHFRLSRCVAQQCWWIGKLKFRAKKRWVPQTTLWPYLVAHSDRVVRRTGALRSRRTLEGYTLSLEAGCRAGRKRRASHGRAFEATRPRLRNVFSRTRAATTRWWQSPPSSPPTQPP